MEQDRKYPLHEGYSHIRKGETGKQIHNSLETAELLRRLRRHLFHDGAKETGVDHDSIDNILCIRHPQYQNHLEAAVADAVGNGSFPVPALFR